jgi:hypothetical protein
MACRYEILHLEIAASELLPLICSALAERVGSYDELSSVDLSDDPAMIHYRPSDRAYALAESVVEMLQPSPISECNDVFRIITTEFLSYVSKMHTTLQKR